jgi:hypothetical protein
MKYFICALLALVSAAPVFADWTGPRFQFDPESRSWTRTGGEPADHNLFDPDDNFVARFEGGRLKILFDNNPDAGPRSKPDDIYAFGDAGASERLGRVLGQVPAPVDLLFSAPAASAPAAGRGLVRQAFADGVWTNVRQEDSYVVTEDQFLSAGSPGDRALVERYAVKNVSGSTLKLKIRAVVWAVLENAVVDYWHEFKPSWTAAESWDPGLQAAVAQSADGRLWLAAGVLSDRPDLNWTPETPPDAGVPVVVWGAEASLAPDEVRSLALAVAVGATREEAAAAYARLASAGSEAAEERTRLAWHRRVWERGVFKTGDASLDSLNELKYVLNANYASENGGFTAAKYGHPEIWARDSGYMSLSSAYFEPERTRQTLETAIRSGYVAGQDGTSMLVIASEHYARWTGDRTFARDNVAALKKGMQDLWDSRSRDGFLVDRGGGFDTWRDMPVQQEKLKGKPNMYQQVLFSAALDRLGRLLTDVGQGEEAKIWGRRSRQVADALNRAVDQGGFWLPGAGFYADYIDPRDDEGRRHYDEVGHSLGVLWDVFPGERASSVMTQAALGLASANGLGHANIQPYGPRPNFNDGEIWPFANFLEAGAQLVSGRDGDFMSLMNGMSRTMGIIPGALTEALPPAQESGGVNPVTTSWNTAGLYVMTHFLFGVDGDGFHRTVTLSPRIPEQLTGAVLSLTELPFSDWLVSVTYRLIEDGRISVDFEAERKGKPDERVRMDFFMRRGESRTIGLSAPANERAPVKAPSRASPAIPARSGP